MKQTTTIFPKSNQSW